MEFIKYDDNLKTSERNNLIIKTQVIEIDNTSHRKIIS